MAGRAALCEELSWDSDFFGVSIARAIPAALDDATAADVLQWCQSRHVECLYFLCPLEDATTQRHLSDAGFQLVGVKVTLARSVDAGNGDVLGRTRPATLADIPRLREIARVSHRDTRFHTDGHFDPARSDELYATWIENSVQGYADHVVVAERETTVVGYVTMHVDASSTAESARRRGRIGLFAVDEQWRNQGIGRDLLRRTAGILRAQGVEETSVMTAGRNVAALKLYKSEGFQTTDVSLWYHRWFRSDRR